MSAVDFFVEDKRYWELCGEVLVLPGSVVGLNKRSVWRFRFHVVAESERWTILLDSTGTILEIDSETLPFEICYQDGNLAVILIASVGVTCVGLLIWIKTAG